MYCIESRRDELQAERQKSRFAERVSAWVAVRLVDDQIAGSGVVLSNASGAMLFDVCISSTDHVGEPLPEITLAAVPPGDFFIEHKRDESWQWAFPDSLDVVCGDLRPVMKKPDWRVDEVEFRDAANSRWRRQGNRLLEPLDS